MTNFEKWKEAATPDDVINTSAFLERDGFRRKQHYTAFNCAFCPARQFCVTDETDDRCRAVFRKWANARYKEAETHRLARY